MEETLEARASGRARRPTLMGRREAVSSGHYLASEAGMRILSAGGNAVDAGVAAAMCLGVLYCDIVNFAGVAPMIIYRKEEDRLVNLCGLGGWPAAADPEHFRRNHGGEIPPGVLRTVLPAAPDTFCTALARFGTCTFGRVAEAAIDLAEEGFAAFPLLVEGIRLNEENLRRWPTNTALFLPGGRAPRVGERFRQRELAETLRRMAAAEQRAGGDRAGGIQAARDEFYRGETAARIDEFYRREGGWLTGNDLAEFAVKEEPVCRVAYKSYEVVACGPWCQGPLLLQALNMLEEADLAGYEHNGADYLHRVIESLNLAFADREGFYGDPDFVDVPMEGLLSKDYARARAARVRPDRAFGEMAPAGDPWAHQQGGGAPPRVSAPAAGGEPGPDFDTSYVCAVDRWGNAFSCTPSDVARDMPVVPGVGCPMSSRGSQSRVEAGHPAVLAPGKRPRLTPNPAMVFKDGRFFMAFGTPGGDSQCQAMLQVFLNIAEFGMSPQEAVEAPRAISGNFPNSFAPHAYQPGALKVEGRIPAGVRTALSGKGHQLIEWPDVWWQAGAVSAIVNDEANGCLLAAADPRRENYAIAW